MDELVQLWWLLETRISFSRLTVKWGKYEWNFNQRWYAHTRKRTLVHNKYFVYLRRMSNRNKVNSIMNFCTILHIRWINAMCSYNYRRTCLLPSESTIYFFLYFNKRKNSKSRISIFKIVFLSVLGSKQYCLTYIHGANELRNSY
jgi:hypothetical protein